MRFGHTQPLALILAIALALPAAAHETDQFTPPAGREFADVSDYLTRLMYEAIAKGVEEHNTRLKQAVESKREKLAENLSDPAQLAQTVNRQFRVAFFLIEDLDKWVARPETRLMYPGKLVGYDPDRGVRKNIELALNPFNAWTCANIHAFGVNFGTDKIGHLTDMGMHYYRTFDEARRNGMDEERAVREALKMGMDGPIYSERGILGLVTAGAYSNADLVSNYMGLCFYRNLTEPVMLKGVQRPPMLVKEGQYWRLADHVRPESDFFSWFVSEHFNEALNPSMYRKDLRKGILKAIVANRHRALAQFADPNGVPWSAARFEAKRRELSTYYGLDYGHEEPSTALTIARSCFARPPDMNKPMSRNDDGWTPMHYAADKGDVAALQRVLDGGGDVNARVVTTANVPAVCGDTPLHLAARDGHLQAAQLLIARGANVNIRNDRGASPLHYAIAHPQLAQLLLDSGAQVDASDVAGRTVLHWASYDPRATQTLVLLLERGAAPSPADRDRAAPLHDAARAQHVHAVAALARSKANMNAVDRLGETPLHIAAASGSAQMIEALLRAGALADVADTFGCTPLHVAARQRRPHAVAALLSHGADATAIDAYGQTALAVAKRQGAESVERQLQTPPPLSEPMESPESVRIPAAEIPAPTLSSDPPQ